MTQQEQDLRANVTVATVQNAWGHMCDVAIAARVEATLLAQKLAASEARVKELEDKYEPGTPVQSAQE